MDYFDPDGDVTLEVGQELKAHYVVSSKAMSLASPVFKAMLSPRFREGSELAAGILKPIPLPDDDPDGMAIICGILHHKTDGVPTRPSLQTIGDVAMLCDKYKIRDAVHGWTQAWLLNYRRILKSPEIRDEMLALLWITLALDNAENFTAISRAFILNYCNNAEFKKNSPGLDLLHSGVMPELIKTAKEFKEETLGKYSRLLEPLFSPISYSETPLNCNHCRVSRIPNHCQRAIHKALFCISESNRTGLRICPDPTVSSLSSMITSLSQFRTFEEPVRMFCLQHCSCRTNIEEQIRLLATEVQSNVKGLCLDCFGKGGTKKGACRVENALHIEPDEEGDTADTTSDTSQ